MPLTKVDEYYLRNRSAPVIRCRGFFLLCQHTVWYVGTTQLPPRNFSMVVWPTPLCFNCMKLLASEIIRLIDLLTRQASSQLSYFDNKKGIPADTPILWFKALGHSGVLIPSFAVPFQIVQVPCLRLLTILCIINQRHVVSDPWPLFSGDRRRISYPVMTMTGRDEPEIRFLCFHSPKVS